MNMNAYKRLKAKYVGLIGSRCVRCGSEFFPSVRACRRCGSFDMEDTPMPPTGKVLSHTILNVPSQEFKDEAPLIIALIELSNGVRLISQLTDINPADVRDNMPVKMEVGELQRSNDPNQKILGYKFVKAQER